jgi:hypothetical protein
MQSSGVTKLGGPGQKTVFGIPGTGHWLTVYPQHVQAPNASMATIVKITVDFLTIPSSSFH